MAQVLIAQFNSRVYENFFYCIYRDDQTFDVSVRPMVGGAIDPSGMPWPDVTRFAQLYELAHRHNNIAFAACQEIIKQASKVNPP